MSGKAVGRNLTRIPRESSSGDVGSGPADHFPDIIKLVDFTGFLKCLCFLFIKSVVL